MDPMTMMLISGGLSALGGGLSAFGKKKPAQLTPSIPPEMMARQQKAWQMGLGGMEDPYKGFDPIAQQARSQFQTQTLPSIAERFTSMGQGGQRSSDFAGALGQSGADLEGNILAQRSQYGLQNRGLLQQLMGMGMGSTGDYIYQPEQLGGLQQFGATLGGAAAPMIGKGYEAYEARKSGGSEQLMSLLQKLLGGAQ